MKMPLVVAMLALSAAAQAQESEPAPPPPPPHEPFTQGSFTVDAMTTPGRHMGFGFYLSNRVSIRPMIGFGYSELNGSFYNVGADLRVETMPANRWSFYGVATGSYRNKPAGYQGRRAQDLYVQEAGGEFGAGVGVRRRVHDRLMVVLDTRYLRSTTAYFSSGSSFGQFGADGRNQFVASLGLSFSLN